MGLTIVQIASADSLSTVLAEQLEALQSTDGIELIVPTRRMAQRLRHAFADRDARLMFGVGVGTWADWVKEAWLRYGDGSRLVTQDERVFLVAAALGEGEAYGLTPRLGTVDVISAVITGGCGDAVFERALSRERERVAETGSAAGAGSAVGAGSAGEANLVGETSSDGGAVAAGKARLAVEARLDHEADPAGQTSSVGELADGEGQALSEVEHAILAVVARYLDEVAARGACEPNVALRALPQRLVRPPRFVLAGFHRFAPAERACVAALAKVTQVLVLVETAGGGEARTCSDVLARDLCSLCPEATVVALPPTAQGLPATELSALKEHLFASGVPVEHTGAVRFAFAAGRYAEPPLIAHVVERYVEEGIRPERIAIACKDSAQTFSVVAPFLMRAGIASEAKYSLPLHATALGRAFLLMSSLQEAASADASVYDKTLAIDFVRNPLSGISSDRANRLSARWRRDRMCDLGECLHDLRAGSKVAEALFAACEQGDLMQAVEILREQANALPPVAVEPFDPAWNRKLQNAAAATMKTTIASLGRAGSFSDGKALLFKLLERKRVPIASSYGDTEAGALHFCSLRELEFETYDVVIFADLTARAYPASSEDDAASELLGKLGIATAIDGVSESRWYFAHALAAAGKAVVFERPLKDADAGDERASFLFEELVDCYLADPADVDAVDRVTGLPLTFPAAYCWQKGEGDLCEIVGAAAAADDTAGTADLSFCGETPAAWRVDPSGLVRTVLSPSTLELYRACPYRWFVERVLCVDSVDAGFGPVEKGDFAHAVLKEFYDRLRARDGQRARRLHKNDGADRRLFEEAVAAVRAAQGRSGDERKNPFVPLTELERQEARRLCQSLWHALERDADFLPAFHPAYLEHGFGRLFEERDFIYAGVSVSGRIDRIDVDDAGHAVVIDYKGSCGKHYALPGATDVCSDTVPDPEKIQTLIYARAVEQTLGLQVVGALYCSYRQDVRHGAYDARFIGLSDIGGRIADTEGLPNKDYEDIDFPCLLKATEQRIAEALEHLRQGDVAPRPYFEDSCGYCPVRECPRGTVPPPLDVPTNASCVASCSDEGRETR